MKMSLLFGQTLRETTPDSDRTGLGLLNRAGYLRSVSKYPVTLLPLGLRSLTKIQDLLRQDLLGLGGQEIVTAWPFLADGLNAPFSKQSKDSSKLPPSIEDDPVASSNKRSGKGLFDLFNQEIRSYKQLPRLLFQIEHRGATNKIHETVSQTLVLSGASLNAITSEREHSYRALLDHFINSFKQFRLEPKVVACSKEENAENQTIALAVPTHAGPDSWIACESCDYASSLDYALFLKEPAIPEKIKDLTLVATPECKTIQELADFLAVLKAQTAKAVFFEATILDRGQSVKRMIFALIRGDLTINESKLAHAIGATKLLSAEPDSLAFHGIIPGYASPVGISAAVKGSIRQPMVVLDDSIACSVNLVSGGNQAGFHYLNTNYPRDFNADIVTDVAAAQDGDQCLHCGCRLHKVSGYYLGWFIKSSGINNDNNECNYTGADGSSRPIELVFFQVDLGQLLACVADAHHDQVGLALPNTIAPFHVHLILLRSREGKQSEDFATSLYTALIRSGLDVLLDDRDESPGRKFADADLLGIPIRVTISDRSLAQGGVEFCYRNNLSKSIIPMKDSLAFILQSSNQMIGREGPVPN